MKTSATERNTRSTVLYDEKSTSAQMPTATTGTTMYREIPKISSAADAPENSATVLAMFAMSSTTMAKTVQRTPNRSRIRSDRPWPVTTPSRAAISWTTDRMTVVIGNSQSNVSPVVAPITL